MLQAKAFANAVATVTGVAYVLCRVITAIAPRFLFRIAQSWFHTINLDFNLTQGSMSFGAFILGLVSSVVLSWIAAYVVATLYNRFAKT